MPTVFQVPSVQLHGDETTLVLRIRAKLEAEENKSISIADIVRLALRELAKAKGI